VIYGTGSDQILERLPPTTEAFEFQFEPDPRPLIQTVLPNLDALRGATNDTHGGTPFERNTT
jgi:hypothetical protein